MSSKVLIEKIRLIEGLIEKGPNCINCEIWGKMEINICTKAVLDSSSSITLKNHQKLWESN